MIVVSVCFIVKSRMDKDMISLTEKGHEASNGLMMRSQQSQSHTMQQITSEDLSKQVVSVTGILLEKLDTGQREKQKVSHIILVLFA